MIYVIAATQQQAEMWARAKGLGPKEYRRISNFRTACGLPTVATIRTTGPWWSETEVAEVRDELIARGYQITHDNLDALCGLPPELCRA